MSYLINIAPARPFMNYLTYKSDILLPIGTRVEIPIGKSKCFGFVTGHNTNPPNNEYEIKEICAVLGEHPLFSEINFKFYKWVAEYYHYPMGELLSLIMPSYTPKTGSKRKPKIRTVEETKVRIEKPLVDFTDEQIKVFNELFESMFGKNLENKREENKSTERPGYLLQGVTGSGKTEVYIELMKHVINSGKGVLVVVPEIALTPQLIERISRHFRGSISVLHSAVSKKQKFDYWMNIASGKTLLAVGARSAIFSPFPNLGLVIVDEEHDSSYKQEDRVRYNARDLSLVLGKINLAPVILSSATPSIESYHNAITKKYNYVQLNKRVRGLSLPESIIIDMKKANLVTPSISVELVKRIKETVNKGEQTILYINRRGFSNTVICKDCGESFKCPYCAITLTEHREIKLMVCHYCGYHRSLPNFCNSCQSDELLSCGYGTERIYSEISGLFPDYRIARLDSDAIQTKGTLAKLLAKIHANELDIIIGTQILGKGHDFPNVTLVGIVNADTTMRLPDFRSSERTFQQLVQVSGRAGRASKGLVVTQTYMPEHFAIRSAITNDFEGFYTKELEHRKEAMYPPFSFLADIRFAGKDKNKVIQLAEQGIGILNKILEKRGDGIHVLGPAPSPISIINNNHRYHILLKSQSRAQLVPVLESFSLSINRSKYVRVNIDVDPYSIL